MKRDVRKILAAVLSVAMVGSLASCSLFDKSAEEVQAATEAFCSALDNAKGSKLEKMIFEPEDDFAEGLQDSLDNADFDDEDLKAVMDAITESFAYEIDEESIESSAKDGEGSIDVTFSFVDYESVAGNEDNCKDVETFLAALDDCKDVIEKDVTLEFVKDEDSWFLDNYEEVFDEYFAYQDFSIEFMPDFIEMVDYTYWYYTDISDSYEVYYLNAYQMEMDIFYTSEGYEYDWSGCTFDVTHDGANIYNGSCDVYSSFLECHYFAEGDYLEPGNYTITVYDPEGNNIASDSCYVDFIEETEPTTEEDLPDGTTIEDLCGFYDEDFDNATVDVRWWDWEDAVDENGDVVDVLYYGDTYDNTYATYLEYSIQVEDFDETVYYEFYYSADGTYDGLECIYSDTMSINSYNDGDFYEPRYESDELLPGTYLLIVMDETMENVYFADYCYVVEGV